MTTIDRVPTPVFPELRGMDLLDEVMRVVRERPEQWNQSSWSDFGGLDGDDFEGLEDVRIVVPEVHAAYVPVTCNTTFCIAGWATTLTGGKWADDEYMVFDPNLDDVDDKEVLTVEGKTPSGEWVDTEVEVIPCSNRAQALLGLTTEEADALFNGSNKMEDVEEVVRQIKRSRETV